jgi:RimJ/RimL family protein N-acetyltransferase
MQFTEEAISEEFERLNFNHRGYNHPLMHRRIKVDDTLALSKVLKRSSKHLSGYIGWAQYAGKWDFKQIQRFVNEHVNDEFPREHFLFLIDKQIVGMGSIAPMGDIRDVQVALWVAEGHHGKGIGARIVSTIEWYVFEVYGYRSLYYQHDATNESSKRLPQKLDYQFSHSFDERISAYNESGLWFSWRKDRPEDLPPGILQGADIEEFMQVRFKGRNM